MNTKTKRRKYNERVVGNCANCGNVCRAHNSHHGPLYAGVSCNECFAQICIVRKLLTFMYPKEFEIWSKKERRLLAKEIDVKSHFGAYFDMIYYHGHDGSLGIGEH